MILFVLLQDRRTLVNMSRSRLPTLDLVEKVYYELASWPRLLTGALAWTYSGVGFATQVLRGSTMLTLFTENPTPLYLVLGAAAVVVVALFVTSRRVLYLGILAGLVVLAGLVFLIDVLVETDREAVQRKTHLLADCAARGDLAGLELLFSKDFRTEGVGLKAWMERARAFVPPGQRRTVDVWNLDLPKNLNPKAITVRCNARGAGQFGPLTVDPPYIGGLDLVFGKDADGEWRITQLRVTNMQGDPIPIPTR